MSVSIRSALLSTLLLGMPVTIASAQQPSSGHTYTVNCDGAKQSTENDLHSLDEVNSLSLDSGDKVLFKRGTVCHGSLHPRGSGFHIGAYGVGPLPMIEAASSDEEALRLFNQEQISIDSLELRGGTTYGVYISGDHGTMHSISLSNLTVSGVRGNLQKKESGLVVIRSASPKATFQDVHLDSIRAFDTTQWAGILIVGTSRNNPAQSITIDHSVVHDVQGDGIAIFNGSQSSIKHSVAWHTGMQHQQSIGTPNAIWTWQCNACVVEGNEAFLTDSPGVDGGAFDIDWGNMSNRYLQNFAHDTQGYCISVFAANGPTKDSVISGNVCHNNGLSPRLAQRQGAILLMTWNSGTIDGVDIDNNRVDWQPAGNTPLVQIGDGLNITGIVLRNNEFHSTGTMFVDPALTYRGSSNQFFLEHATDADLAEVRQGLLPAHAGDAKVELEPANSLLPRAGMHAIGWRLIATVPAHGSHTPQNLSAVLLNLRIAAIEYSHAGLAVSMAGDMDSLQAACDWQLPEEGVELKKLSTSQPLKFSLTLLAPGGRMVRTWSDAATFIDLGMALRKALGEPDYGRLQIENIRATN